MALFGQENRLISFVGDAADKFILREIEGEEGLSAPYCYQLRFHSELSGDKMTGFLGKELACKIGQEKESRYIHGVLTHIRSTGDGNYIGTLEPRMALLQLSHNLAVFQNITVPDLVCKLLRQHQINNIELRLSGNYKPREYCIQYRESDFNFINRLLEQEGIYYFFKHQQGQHTLVLVDHAAGHPSAKTAKLKFGLQVFDGAEITEWSSHSAVVASSVLLKGFSVAQADKVEGESPTRDKLHSIAGLHYVDTHGDEKHDQLSSGARLKMEQMEAEMQQFDARVSAYWLSCGEKFALDDHPVFNGDYRIKSIRLKAASNIVNDRPDFSCEITTFKDSTVWRPAAKTAIPQVPGILTAVVVGPASEEIHTDKLGRIKIQFPWDNENKHDDGSSCWIRVAQAWAASQSGAVFLPRVGNEVLVSFINGNPDLPVVIGSVYNGKNIPPLNLPGEKNHSGFVSRSSLNGTVEEGHELRFDDKKGEEKLHITSQKDLIVQIKNDVKTEIAHQVTETIGADRATTITKGKDSLTLKQGDRSLELEQGNHSVQLKQGNHSVQLKQGDSILALDQGDSTTTLKQGDFSTQLKQGNYSLDIKGNLNEALTGGDHQLKVSGGGSVVKADKACVIESTQSIELKVGSSKISISPAGITLSGVTIKINGSGTAELKGAMVTVQGSGMTQIKGGVTMIG
ncbi:type VI secretion system Vgr family protein [Yersinia enterocolitica]|uniref:type VI secretion system Vgr family protein n=1 Tax=Yersinia enterocolitica TaxID=630 RepID=UPI00094BB20B|nr:type VI secretion system tip protein TssI/VgrG [Yersinia enterocolitica]EKN4037486.1 type VI secretion system tip protein VgrG [Yersinia enterocolitica]OWF82262.1 type IV secretion protein Rhs [Yersinia kristensenii]